MSSTIVSVPKYRRHKGSGQAFVQIKGRRHYLGKWDSADSKERYAAFVAELAICPTAINFFLLASPVTQITVVELADNRPASSAASVAPSGGKNPSHPARGRPFQGTHRRPVPPGPVTLGARRCSQTHAPQSSPRPPLDRGADRESPRKCDAKSLAEPSPVHGSAAPIRSGPGG
jgi:hypothetical protein